MSGVDGKVIAMHARNEFSRSSLDISRMDIACLHGVVNVYGWIGRLRGDNSEDEEDTVQGRIEKASERIKRIPGVREIVVYARIRE